MIQDTIENDILDYVNNSILCDEYGEMDLSEYLIMVDEKFIDEVLECNGFKFIKKGKGIYEIKK